MSTNPQELALQYGQAWASRDPDVIVALHTEDSVFHLHNITQPACGRAAVREAIADAFEQSPDLSFERMRVVFGVEHFVTEYEMSGTADGKRFVCDGADVFTLRDGLIARKDSYVDWLSFQRQVGIDPAVVS